MTTAPARQLDGRSHSPNDKRALVIDEMIGLGSRCKPLKGNPGRGCGVKQTREAERGANRREREKR